MIIQIKWDFDLPSDFTMNDHDDFAEKNGIPLKVDLNDFFDDPENTGIFTITDALSDTYGWLVLDWFVIDSI